MGCFLYLPDLGKGWGFWWTGFLPQLGSEEGPGAGEPFPHLRDMWNKGWDRNSEDPCTNLNWGRGEVG